MPASQRAIETNKQVIVLNRIMSAWRGKPKNPSATRRLHLHFYAKPVEIVGDEAGITALRYERTRPDGAGGVTGTGEIRELAVQAVYRAVGYFGSPLPGIPFDDKRGVIPNVRARCSTITIRSCTGCTPPAGSSADRSA